MSRTNSGEGRSSCRRYLFCASLSHFGIRSTSAPKANLDPESSDEDEVEVKLIVPIPGDMDVRKTRFVLVDIYFLILLRHDNDWCAF